MVALRTPPEKLQRSRDHYRHCRQTGRCTQCTEVAVAGRTRCRACLKKASQTALERYRRRCIQQIEAGLCVLCDNPSPDYAICDYCRGKAAARLQARRNQNRHSSTTISQR